MDRPPNSNFGGTVLPVPLGLRRCFFVVDLICISEDVLIEYFIH